MSNNLVFYDTETCGLAGQMVLLQYAEGGGPVTLYEVWREPISKTLELIEWLLGNTLIGFNLAYDHFFLSKTYTTFKLFPDHNAIPENHIDELAILEEQARFSDICLKPKGALDLMLFARRGPYQSLMARHDISVKRVPTRLALMLAAELERRVELDGIYFARRANEALPQWGVYDVHLPDGELDPNFKNISLKFAASGGLKALAKFALKEDTVEFSDIELDKKYRPLEKGWAPYNTIIDGPGAWPDVIKYHIAHWRDNKAARTYAEKDVELTRKLFYFFNEPEPNDTDSTLACMVPAVRWRGFKVDLPKLRTLRDKAEVAKKDTPTAPNAVKVYLSEVMDKTELIILREGTGERILVSISEWKNDSQPHPAAVRAKEVLTARHAIKEIETLSKLISAERFHASFRVIGSLSGRMAGDSGLNAMGIKNTTEMRSCFPMADEGFVLSMSDFSAFEISIAEAVYNDPKLREDLLGGKKLHALFAMELFNKSYEEVMATKGTEDDLYTMGKQGIFGMLYGGTEYTLQTRLGVDEETAIKAFEKFTKKYPGIGKAREKIKEDFCSMTQPGGIGTEVIWKEPADYAANLFGLKRYFTLENRICKALFELAQKPPPSWKKIRIKVKRRERMQTASGATQSALYGAAFGIQAANMRQAGNNEIQSSGAYITKEVEAAIWKLQPSGVHPWLVQPMQIHDEILAVCKPEIVDKIAKVVDETVETFRSAVPLIKLDWRKENKSWAK
jgi:hypothetical protein